MWGTASAWRARGPELGWLAFGVVNVAAMLRWPHAPTIPFHFIWISLTVLYAVRPWPVAPTLVVLAGVCLTTGFVMTQLVVEHDVDWEEITEVPLMAMVFLVMVWNTQHRLAAARSLEQMADRERALRRQEQTFARQASHELRSPLSLARGHVQLAQQSLGDAPQTADLDVALAQMDRLSAITRRLLMLGSMDNVETLQLQPTAVEQLALDVVARWAATHTREWGLPRQTRVVAAVDPHRVTAALDELLDNAVAHTSEHDRVAVDIAVDGRDLVIQVSDSGPGIPTEWQASVFETFWRAPDSPHTGTGLGLSIVRAVARAHGGDAEVVSLAGQRGTTFVLTFPGVVRPYATAVATRAPLRVH